MKTILKEGESVVLITKPHWYTLIGPCLITIAGTVICIVIGSYALIAICLFIGYFVFEIIKRNNNLWAVTNLRVIDEYGVFTNNTKESPLDKINNVSYTQTFWGKIFGYGNVQIQTAAEIGSTTYNAVEKPKELKDTITRMQEEYKKQQMKDQATELAKAIVANQKASKTDIASELERLYELKEKGIITEEEFTARKTKILNS
jgi:uncharacterized membrane protein YdbT with pleckstrin-like domain